MCEERVRRKVLLAAASFDDSPNRGGEENNEKIKMKKTYERRSGGRTDVRSIEEIKAEIALVERQLREKKREEEEEEERRKKLRAMKMQSDREREGNRRYRRCGINNSGGVDAAANGLAWIDRKGPEPASRAMARRLLETLEERWSDDEDDACSSSSSSESGCEEDNEDDISLASRSLVTFTSRNNTSKKEEGENKTKRHHQKLKMLETIARETSRQIHAQCRDRGELVDAVLDRYRDIIDVKNQQMEEMRLQNRRLSAMRDFANTQSERDGEEKIALAKSLAATRREQKRVQMLNEKISSEFANAKLRWQEISSERKNRRDLERDALLKAQKELKQLKETMFREIRAQTMVLEKKLVHALDSRDDSKESLRYAEERLRVALAKTPRGKPVDTDAQTNRRWMKHVIANGEDGSLLGIGCDDMADASSQTDADLVMLGWHTRDNNNNDDGIETTSASMKKRRGDGRTNRNASAYSSSPSAGRSFTLGGFARLIQTSKINGREKPKSWTLRTVAQIYADKIAAEKDQEKQQQQQQQQQQTSTHIGGGSHNDLASFAYEWHVHRYGLRQLAETNCLDLIASCKVHSTSSLKIRQFAAFCGLLESSTSTCSPNGTVLNTDESNSAHFGGDRDTYDFYLKVLDALAPNGHISSLFPENESANGKAIKISEVQSNTASVKMMNFDDSGKVTFSHACEAVKALLFPDVLVNEKTSAQFSNSTSNNNSTLRLTEKEKMDALARAFLFHRGVEASSPSSSSSSSNGIKKKVTGTTVDADDVVSILMTEHEKRSKRNMRALIVLFRAMNCEDHVGESISTNSSLSSSGLSREDFYAAFRIASDSALTESNIHVAWKECVNMCIRSSAIGPVEAPSDIGRKKKMTKKKNARGTKLSKQRKTAHIGEDVMISETVAASNESIVDVDALVRIPDHVFVSVAKKRCFLGAFEIQYEKRSPRGIEEVQEEQIAYENPITTKITAESAYYDSFETECRFCKELFDLHDDLKSKFDPPHPSATLDSSAMQIIHTSLLRCEKLRNKYIREQQTQTHAGQNQQQNFSRKEKTFLRALVLKALSLELQKIQVKRRGGIKRVGELVRATVSFKLRNAFREQ